ncbi:MAG TPA: DUF885 domain-containing protein [Candidatus Limnocylindria bacterium]|nr:DUF885 domain-containing protein [Candidatus Limnocylindria bacterium]
MTVPSTTPASAANDAEARFDRTVERWFRDLLSLSPETATFVGFHDHDADLSRTDRESVETRVAFWRRTIDEMERFAPDEMSAERALDRDLLLHEGRLELHRLQEHRLWERSSDAAEHIGDALFPLFTRDFAPLAERLESIAGRLEQAPRYLAESRTRVSRPVRLWTEIDLESSESLPSFLETILAATRAELGEGGLTERLSRAVEGTRSALDDHVTWLRSEALSRATDDWATGSQLFDELVRLRELDATADEILAVGERMLADERAAREEVCREIDPTLSPGEVGDLVKNHHPASFPEALDEYRRAMDRARAFIAERDLASFPEQDKLLVAETPAYIRHLIPFAAYYEPARFDPDPLGIYIVTPPATPEMMREHSYASISNTGVHEAYPGHHLQLSSGLTNPSLVRLLTGAPEFVEGWAFYCERMMKEAGFDDTPEHWYIVHTDAIWRAVRIVLDVRLHRGDIGFDDAVDFLIEQTGFERPAAVAEVKRYTSTPTYQLSYLYGRHMIESLRDDVERRMGPAYSMKFFHDTLLYGGTMPVHYARRLFDARLRSDGGGQPA